MALFLETGTATEVRHQLFWWCKDNFTEKGRDQEAETRKTAIYHDRNRKYFSSSPDSLVGCRGDEGGASTLDFRDVQRFEAVELRARGGKLFTRRGRSEKSGRVCREMVLGVGRNF